MPSILHPSRITDTNSTLIDNIFLSNVTDCNIHSGNLLAMISDHLPQFAILKHNAPEYKNTSNFDDDYSMFDETSFQNIQNLIYPILMMNVLIEIKKVDTFLLNLDNLLQKLCPEKKLNKKMLKLRNKPWIDFKIQKMMKIRDKLFKQFKDSNSPAALIAYTNFRNPTVNEIRQSKKEYYQE